MHGALRHVRGMSLNSVRTGYRRVERVFRRLYLAAGNCGKSHCLIRIFRAVDGADLPPFLFGGGKLRKEHCLIGIFRAVDSAAAKAIFAVV